MRDSTTTIASEPRKQSLPSDPAEWAPLPSGPCDRYDRPTPRGAGVSEVSIASIATLVAPSNFQADRGSVPSGVTSMSPGETTLGSKGEQEVALDRSS